MKYYLSLLMGCLLTSSVWADAPPLKLLLIGSGPDGHPVQTHEYMAGLKVLRKCLADVPGLEITTVRADEPWREGPELIARADGVVLFLSEGARWMNHDPKRREALATLAKHGGGISVLHWAMGTKDAKYIEGCLQLLGGCHGGPDRKYKVLETQAAVADGKHPLMAGIKDFRVRDEFYYRLKFTKADRGFHPLLRVTIDGQQETVAWCWERPDHGRSFGFSGLHFHENWRLPAYRRLVAQGVLWTLKKPIPKDGLSVKVTDDDLKLPAKKAEPPQEKSADPLPSGALLRLGTPRLRHAGAIGPVVFAPDGKSLASGGGDQAVRIWDVATGQQKQLLLGHHSYLVSLAFSPDGKRLASGSFHERDRLRLWDVASGKQLWTFRPPGRHVMALAFSPDGKTLALATDNGRVLLLDALDGKERLRLVAATAQAICSLLFSPDGGSLLVCAHSSPVQVWDATTGKEVRRLPEARSVEIFRTAAFSRDGKTVCVTGLRDLPGEGGSRSVAEVRTIDAANGKLVSTRRYDPTGPEVEAVDLSPDGKVGAARCGNGMVHLWNVDTSARLRILARRPLQPFLGYRLVFSPDGRVLAIAGFNGDRAIELWNTATGKALHQDEGHEARLRAVIVSPDGSRIATGGDDHTARLWDRATGKLLHTFEARRAVLSLAFSPDGRTLAVGDAHEEARLWDVRSSKLLHRLYAASCSFVALAFLPDGKSLVSGHRGIFDESEVAEMAGCLRIWDVATGRERRCLEGFPLDSSFSPALLVRPSGQEIVALHADDRLRSWQLETGKSRTIVNTCPPGVRLLSGAFSLDGTLFVGNLGDGPVRVWDLTRKGSLLPLSIADTFGQALAFSPDRRFLVIAGMRVDADAPAEERTIRLWELATGKEAFRLPLPAGNAVDCLTFPPDGRTLIAGMADTTVLLWDLVDGGSRERLTDAELERAWIDLGGDARTAYRAAQRLASAPAQAVPLLSAKLRPVPPPDAEQIARLLVELDDAAFAVREGAERELDKLGGAVEPALREELTKRPSLEVRRRIEGLLARLDSSASLSADTLREVRAVMALEWAATPPARQYLQTLAEGAAGARLTREARAAWRHLAGPIPARP